MSILLCINYGGRYKWNFNCDLLFRGTSNIFFTSNELSWNWWLFLWFTKQTTNSFCNIVMLHTWNEMIRKLNMLRDWIKQFGMTNFESFFICSESNTILLQLFHEPYTTYMFQRRIIRFFKLTKLWQK